MPTTITDQSPDKRAPVIENGLILSNPDFTSSEEVEQFTRTHAGGRWPDGFPTNLLFWSFRPDVVKRFRLLMREYMKVRFAPTLRLLHYYAVSGFSDGVLYEIKGSATAGHTRAEVIDTLAIAYQHAAAKNLHNVAADARDALRKYQEPERPYAKWPEGWKVDDEAFKSGLDFSNSELTPQECELLDAWYMRYLGEIPGHVRLLGEYAPSVLKAHRNRFEHAIRGGLPKQCVPMFQLEMNINRLSEDGVRESLLLARGFGMKRSQVVYIITEALVWGGEASISLVQRAGGEILRSWDDWVPPK
jgi:hypothetical protein